MACGQHFAYLVERSQADNHALRLYCNCSGFLCIMRLQCLKTGMNSSRLGQFAGSHGCSDPHWSEDAAQDRQGRKPPQYPGIPDASTATAHLDQALSKFPRQAPCPVGPGQTWLIRDAVGTNILPTARGALLLQLAPSGCLGTSRQFIVSALNGHILLSDSTDLG